MPQDAAGGTGNASAADAMAPAGPAQWEATILAFLRRHLETSGASGVVVGVSGGLDSAVVATLAVRAFGAGKVVPLLLPAPESDPQDLAHARLACEALALSPIVRPIGPVVQALDEVTGASEPGGPGGAPGDGEDPPQARVPVNAQPRSHGSVHNILGTRGPEDLQARVRGNLRARARMAVLYAEAQARNLLVCGTGNKSELLAGYFTKWGDGGVDINPIGDLYKIQVRDLARHLGVPDAIIAKPPSAGLHPGQTDERDMGITYEDLDAILRCIELNLPRQAILGRTGLGADVVGRVEAMVRSSEHKRRLPLIPKIGARTVGIDWYRSVQWSRKPDDGRD